MSVNNPLPYYRIVDLETSVKNAEGKSDIPIGNFKASPFSPNNKIVVSGWTRQNTYITSKSDIPYPNQHFLFVGCNFKFDLLYLLKECEGWGMNIPKIKIWDISAVEYLISGQMEKFAGLGDTRNKQGEVIKQGLATRYGGTDKIDEIKRLWDEGVDTEDIDGELLTEYLEGDLRNTEIVFKRQWDIVNDLGILPLVESQMDALLATTMMEFNGMYTDIQKMYDDVMVLSKDREALSTNLEKFMQKFLKSKVNLNSSRQLSLVLFGGTEVYEEKFPMCAGVPVDLNTPGFDKAWCDRYKSGIKKGEIKYKKVKLENVIPSVSYTVAMNIPQTKAEGIYQTNDKVLSKLAKIVDPITGQFIDDMLSYRKLNKDIETYYVGYAKLRWPHDGCIHGNLNHTATNTGRLSSSNPNQQNLSRGNT